MDQGLCSVKVCNSQFIIDRWNWKDIRNQACLGLFFEYLDPKKGGTKNEAGQASYDTPFQTAQAHVVKPYDCFLLGLADPQR